MDTLLVTGAAGQLGQRVLHHLLHTLQVPARRVVATSRRPEALAAWAARGVTVRPADFDDGPGLVAAFAGATRLLLISTDTLDRPGHRLAQHTQALRAAERAGVQHLVYTSMPRPEGSPLLIAPDHAGTEQAIAASTLPGWTVLRNHWYFDNLLFTLPGVLARGGQWFSAAGDGRTADISRDDLALAAATVLAGRSGGHLVHTLSGAEALTVAEQAALLARELERPITVVPVPVDALVQGLQGAGFPEPVARALASFDTNTAAGRVAEVTPDFERLTGRAPQRLAAWVRAHRAQLLSA